MKTNNKNNIKGKETHDAFMQGQQQGGNHGGGGLNGGKTGNQTGKNNSIAQQRDQDGDFQGRKGKK